MRGRGHAADATRPRRVAIYARYSTELQSAASIEDQVRVCRDLINRNGWKEAEVYADAAISGTSTKHRPSYLRLLEDARDAKFDIIIAEALDRLSRDQEDVAALFKRMQFAGIQLFTLAEGLIDAMQIGFKGTMNSLYTKDLAAKTHRGLEGRVRAGLSGGGLCYGYRAIHQLDQKGEPIRGERRIEEGEAEIVRRIFRMFAAGQSPRAIAKQLNLERVVGPNGGTWADTTIRGHAARGTGILRNRLYIGERVWNRQRYMKDPETERRVSRPRSAAELVVMPVPDLRIVDQD
jgi:DNA invertase Pin-like site-specific DNA recombinase